MSVKINVYLYIFKIFWLQYEFFIRIFVLNFQPLIIKTFNYFLIIMVDNFRNVDTMLITLISYKKFISIYFQYFSTAIIVSVYQEHCITFSDVLITK